MAIYNGVHFPDKGDKLVFVGVPQFFYPMLRDMRERANTTLVIGREYIARHVEVYSSWCAVWLEGIDGEQDYFNLSFFDEVEINLPIQNDSYGENE